MKRGTAYPFIKHTVSNVKNRRKKHTYTVIYSSRQKSKPLTDKESLVEEIYRPGQHITNYQRGLLWSEVASSKKIKSISRPPLYYEPRDIFSYYTQTPTLRELDSYWVRRFADDNLLLEFESPNDRFFIFSNENIYSPAFATKKAAYIALLNMHSYAVKMQFAFSDEEFSGLLKLAHDCPNITGVIARPSFFA